MAEPIPVSVLTGFLGSGKTTLLGRLLRQPGLGDTAVIVNEFGEIGLDHDLIATADEKIVQLLSGCVCCAARGDVGRALLELAGQRDAGTVPAFARVVIETSGLADPAPILQTVMGDPQIAVRFALAQVTTLVDTVHGARTLAAHPEARRQVAAADRVLFSKTDLGDPAPLHAQIAALNPSAELGATVDDIDRIATPARDRPWMAWDTAPAPRHTPGLGTALILRERPVPGAALSLLLQAIILHAGAKILRIKGLVDIAEEPGRPALLHGVQHVFSPLEFLPAWPSADRRSRIVIIGRDIPPYWPSRLLDAFEEEVLAITQSPSARS